MHNFKKKKKNSRRRPEAPFCFRLICLCLWSWRVIGRGMREGRRPEGWQLLVASRWGLRERRGGGGGRGVGVRGSGWRGRRRRGAASHRARLGHLLLELGDCALQLFPCLPLPAQLFLQLLPVRLRLLQPLTQLRQLAGQRDRERDRHEVNMCLKQIRRRLVQHIITFNNSLS